MTQEEKAKAYDEVVSKLKGFMMQGVDPLITRNDVQDFFPELAESEDEKIRKSLAAYFAKFKPNDMWDDDFSFGDIVAWFEKQGRHAKFINGIQVGDKVTRNEDGVLVNLSQLNRVAKKQGKQKPILDVEIPFGAKDSELKEVTYDIPKGYHAEIADNKVVIKQGEQKPAWSEEDERMMMFCCDYLDDNQKSWLLSLKERYTWKPSDEQMKTLEYYAKLPDHSKVLLMLYNDLKKLTE